MTHWEHFHHEADVGVRGVGATPEEAFCGAAQAMTAVVTEAPVAARVAVAVECAAPDLDLLLVDWLNRLIYEMATRHLLFGRFDVAIGDGRLTATAWGEPVDPVRHQPAVEVKGATFTALRVERAADGQWVAECVVDV